MNHQLFKINNIFSTWNLLAVVSTTLLLCIFSVSPVSGDDDDPKKPKLTIKDIMNKAHKPANPDDSVYLLKKVATGKATQEEAKELHGLYEKLAALTPPKGEQAGWTTKTTALVTAAKAAVDQKEGFKAKLRAASDCAACHKAHR